MVMEGDGGDRGIHLEKLELSFVKVNFPNPIRQVVPLLSHLLPIAIPQLSLSRLSLYQHLRTRS